MADESGWRPIETAPKDGTEVLVATVDWVATASWDAEHEPVSRDEDGNELDYDQWTWEGAWLGDGLNSDESPIVYDPTHWMPLPAPPSEERDA